jgi:putative aldouronate transport system substrate-binding protein
MYLFNYGIEGDSYTIVDGQPQFTQKTLDTYLAMDNPYYAVQSAYGLGDHFFVPSWLNLSKNVFRGESKPGTIDAYYIFDFYKDDPAIMELPVLPPFTIEESAKITEIRRNLDDYSRSEINKFIMGKRPFNEWDVFVREMKSRGSDDLVVIVNTAEQRHLKQK